MSNGRPAQRTVKLEKGYLEDNSTGDIFRFQYNPELFTDSNTVEYRAIKSPGISYPIYQYVGGEPRTIEFTLFVDNMETIRGNNKIRETMVFLQRFLPQPNKGKRYAPPPDLIFAFGWFVKPCLLVSTNARYTMFDRTLQPMRAEIDVTLQVIQ